MHLQRSPRPSPSRRARHASSARPAHRRSAQAAALLTVLLAAAGARADLPETRDFGVERFRLATDRDGLLDVEWAEVRENRPLDVALWLGFARAPLVLYDAVTGDRKAALVDSRTSGALSAAYAPRPWLSLGLELPLVLQQARDAATAAVPGGLDALTSAGLGDLRLAPKVTVLRQGRRGFALAVIPAVVVPTRSASDAYLGDRGLAFAPEVAISRRQGAWRLAANLGYRLRRRATLLDLAIDDEVSLRTGGARSLGAVAGRPLEVSLTASFATAAAAPFGESNQDHLEVLAGGTWRVAPQVQAFAGAGVGLLNGYGTPDWRVLAGARAFFAGQEDPDHDGLFAPADRCPLVAEDRDGFEDHDGCPELDNDRDGVPDAADRCPLVAEDRDAFEDADGCPDPDNDRDGVPDAGDACPDQEGPAENRGCPDTDRDADGRVDRLDRCPDQAEDLDRYEDEDGCPEADNDQDGLVDAQDTCPLKAGPKENLGCPDTDRDGDGVVDRLDNCPDEKGDAANQGCAKKQLVTITDDKLEILESVYFKTDKDVIEKRSFGLLDNVAAVLRSHPGLVIRVEGHTDDQGKAAHNKDLSGRRAAAVRAYLVGKGIEAERLTAAGFGAEQPVADNKTAAGRARNRRVVFAIVGGASGVIQTREQGPATDAPAPPR